MVCNTSCKLGCDDGFHHCAVFGESAVFTASAHNVVCKKHADLVAVDKDKLATSVTDCNAHTVCIRVSAYDDVTADSVRQLNAHTEGVCLFGVGHTDRAKLGVGECLLTDNTDRDTHTTKDCGDRHKATAVDRSVDNLHLVRIFLHRLGGQTLGFNGVKIFVVNVLADDRDIVVKSHVVLALYAVAVKGHFCFVYAKIGG